MVRGAMILVALLPLPGAVAVAQDSTRATVSAERQALTRYFDSLQSIASAARLDDIEPRWNPTQHYFTPATGRLRLGYHQLRAAQLSGDIVDYERALETFDQTTDDDPTRPDAWYAVGLTAIDMRRREFPDRSITQQHMSGYVRYYLGGRSALLQSLSLEPEFMPSLTLLLEMVVEEGDRVQPDGVLQAMETASRLMPDDPRPPLVLGRGARTRGDLAQAVGWFQQYRAVGGDPGVAQLELARSLYALERGDEAIADYWLGLEHPGVNGRALYRSDLSWVADPEDLVEYDRLAINQLAAWVADFWSTRDAAEVRTPGERLREHLRRWVLVHEQFRVSRPEQRAVLNPPWLFERPLPCTTGRDPGLDAVDFLNPGRPRDLRAWEPFLDHRAPIYLRHGEPIRRVSRLKSLPANPAKATVIPGTVAEDGSATHLGVLTPADEVEQPATWEAWAYLIDGEARFYSFVGHVALGTSAPTTLSSRVPTINAEWYWSALSLLADNVGNIDGQARRNQGRSRHDALTREAGLPRALPSYRCSRTYQQWLQRTQSDMELAIHTDGYPLLFPSNLIPTVQAFGLPGLEPNTEGTILVVYSIPLANMALEPSDQNLRRVAVRLRSSAMDTAAGARLWADTTRFLVVPAQPRGNESHLWGYLEMAARPGDYAVGVAVQLADSTAGNVVQVPEHVITWTPGSDLEMSDLVTGKAGSDATYRYHGQAVLLNPLDTFLPSGGVEVFYVQGGLHAGGSYRTTVTITPAGDDDAKLSLGFDEVARQSLEYKRRGIALAGLPAGAYVLAIAIEETETGRSVRRQRVLNVIAQR